MCPRARAPPPVAGGAIRPRSGPRQLAHETACADELTAGFLSGLFGRSRFPLDRAFPGDSRACGRRLPAAGRAMRVEGLSDLLIAILAGAIPARSLAVNRQPSPNGDLVGLSAALIKIPKVRNMSQRRIG